MTLLRSTAGTALCAIVLTVALSGCAIRGGDGVWRSAEGLPASKDVQTPEGQARLERGFLDSRICEARVVIKNNTNRTQTFSVSTFRQVNGTWVPSPVTINVPPGDARSVDANLVANRPAALSRLLNNSSRESVQIPVGSWCASFYGGDGNRYLDGYTFSENRYGYGRFKTGLPGRKIR